MTGYVITALLIKPLRGHARRIRMKPHRDLAAAITKPMEKATYPARHVCKDTIESPAIAALNRALICTLNIDQSIRGKCVSFAPGIRLRFHHREYADVLEEHKDF